MKMFFERLLEFFSKHLETQKINSTEIDYIDIINYTVLSESEAQQQLHKNSAN